MIKNTLLLAFICFFIYSCQQSPTSPNAAAVEETAPATPETPEKAGNNLPQHLIVNIDKFRLREEPGSEGAVLKELPIESVLEDLGERSDFTTQLTLRGVAFDEPWIKVKTEDGTVGWIFGGGIHFGDIHQSELAEQLTRQRMISIFGPRLNKEIEQYREDFEAIQTSSDFAFIYRKGFELRDEIVKITEEKFENPSENMPNLFWMEQAIPGYETALVAEGTIYYLLNDYKQWLEKANKTPEKDDDAYLKVRLLMHKMDSVEYFYPSWFMQTWDYGGHSLLGQGIHLEALELMEKSWEMSTLFHPEVTAVKEQWLSDISGNFVEGGYWEPQAKILAELDKILKGSFNVLEQEDRVAIETRRKMFAKPKANKLQLNMRAG